MTAGPTYLRVWPHRRLYALCLALLLSIAAHAADDIPLGRLPRTAIPVAYRLDLTIVPEYERFSGHVEIDIDVKTTTPALFLHGRDLEMKSAAVISGGNTTPITYKQLDDYGNSRVEFAAPLPVGPATLVFDYDAPFGDGPAGLFRVKVGEDWYVWSQFESIDGRAAFPSFDEPGFKTPFSITITTQPGLLALSNMPETGGATPVGKLLRHRFLPTPPLPTYLVAMVAGPFITAEGSAPPTKLRSQPLPLRIVATRNQAGKLDYALRETPRIVELLEDYFGQPFPFPKLDQIASPIMPGAMENAGADIYQDVILLPGDQASTGQKQLFGMVVSHELSHQWFGDFVTPAWWEDLWLNESFANWMGYRVGNAWRPELNIGINAIDEALTAMSTDSLSAGRPIRQTIGNAGEADAAFDGIAYGKGGQIVAMIASYLGDEKFREGVRLHMRRHPYGSASTDDFFSALADSSGDARVLAALRSFVEQPGVPVIDLARDGAQYRATQSRYLQFGSTAPAQQWLIPFCARRGTESTCKLLDAPTQTFGIAGTGALIPNAGGNGYYRYQLDAADWQALLTEAATLPAGEALFAIDSLWAQWATGKLPSSLLLQAARAFAQNPESNVALYGGSKLAGRQHRGFFPANAEYRQVMRNLYAGKLETLGFDPHAGAHAADTPDRQKLRVELVDLMATEARDANLRQKLTAAARAWLAGDARSLDEAYLRVALTVMLQQGTLADTQALLTRMSGSPDELFHHAALQALGEVGRKADAQWLLDHLNDKRLRVSDGVSLLAGLMQNPDTRELAYAWLLAHYDSYTKSIGIFVVLSIPDMPRQFCSVERAADIERRLLPKAVTGGRGDLPFRRLLEGVRSCGMLKAAKGAEMEAALKQAATVQ